MASRCDWTEHCELCRHLRSQEVAVTSLSLLIIDMGDCCVVKAAKGSVRVGRYDSLEDEITKGLDMVEGDVQVTQMPFADLRAALDEAPVPRIERVVCGKGTVGEGQTVYHIYASDGWDAVDSVAYDALLQLAGHPLPIWEGNGTWEQLPRLPFDQTEQWNEGFIRAKEALPFTAWRYTR